MARTSNEDAIAGVIEDYVMGASLGQSVRLARALHPRFRTAGYFQGSETWLDRDAALATAQASQRAVTARPDWEVRWLKVIGNTAVARVISGWERARFDELLSFLDDGTAWRIVFKTFYVQD